MWKILRIANENAFLSKIAGLQTLTPFSKKYSIILTNKDVINPISSSEVKLSDKVGRIEFIGGNISETFEVFLEAVDNVKPMMQVDIINSGNYVRYSPRTLKPRLQTQLAVNWITEEAIKRCIASRKPIHECLAIEILLAYQKKGGARLKRDRLHKLAMDHRGNVTIKIRE